MACALQSLRACKLSLPCACAAVVTSRQSELGEILGQNNEFWLANVSVAPAQLVHSCSLCRLLSSSGPGIGEPAPLHASRRVPSARCTPRKQPSSARQPAHFYAFIEVVSAPRRGYDELVATSRLTRGRTQKRDTTVDRRERGGCLATVKGCPRLRAAPGRNDARRLAHVRLRRPRLGRIR